MLDSLRTSINSQALISRGIGRVLQVDQQVLTQRGRAEIKVDPPAPGTAKKQLAAGVLVQAGKRGDSGGMIVVKAESREEAGKVVKQAPFVQADLITFETAELHAAVAFK